VCGIAGFFGARTAPPNVIATMHAALAARGPDARHAVLWRGDFERSEHEARAGLLHTRLSIRDLRAVADQPMSNAAGDVWICYNGEVYGWEADARQLEARGYVFKTRSDTEFILHAYQEWGIECLERLRGMFAFAILDLRSRVLYLARDRMGIKPLVYYQRDGELAFGSTLRAVLPYVPPAERRFSAEAIDAYLTHRYVPAPRTIFEEVKRLPHGHYARFELATGAFALTRYWRPQPEPNDFLATLTEAVRLRTVSDRPVGLFLSGGVDSSTVGSVLKAEGFDDITAYTAAFPGTDYDESGAAARIAQRLGLRHEILPIAQAIGADFERIVADLDEPFADPSSFPLWYIARAASRHVRVVMGGDGGDELFAGYKRYAKHLASRWRRRLRLARAARAVAALPGRGQKLRDELAMRWSDAYSLRFSGMSPSLRRYLQPGFACARQVYWDMMPPAAPDALDALLEIDMHNYLPEYILRKGDLCTMAHGLELRVPLLDHRLYQTVLALPRDARFTRPRKLALAAACAPCREFKLFEQKKRGFNPPIGAWLRRELGARLDGLGARLQVVTGGQLDAARAQQLIECFRGGDAARAEQVLQLLILETSLTQLLAHGAHRLH
jgi:asparagine synthase (glutamine-hydrolysing)